MEYKFCYDRVVGILARSVGAKVKGRFRRQIRSSGCHGDSLAPGYWGEPPESVQWTRREMEEALERGRTVGSVAKDGSSRAGEVSGVYNIIP